MSTGGDVLDQAEIDRLVREFAGSGERLAVADDVRYRIRLRRKADVTWLIVAGMVMQPIPDEFCARLERLLAEESVGYAAVDLTACTYLCSGAIGVVARLVCEATGPVFVVGATPRVLHLIEMVGLADRFRVVADAETVARLHAARG